MCVGGGGGACVRACMCVRSLIGSHLTVRSSKVVESKTASVYSAVFGFTLAVLNYTRTFLFQRR